MAWKQGAGAQAVEAAGVFDLDHGEAVVGGLELGAVALGFALGDELLVDDSGEGGAVDFAEVGEVFKLRQEGAAPGEVRGVGEEEHGSVGGVDADEGDGGPAVLLDNGFEVGGERGVDGGEVGRDGRALAGGRAGGRVQAAGGLILVSHGEEVGAEGGVGARAVGGDELLALRGEVGLPGGRGRGGGLRGCDRGCDRWNKGSGEGWQELGEEGCPGHEVDSTAAPGVWPRWQTRRGAGLRGRLRSG